MVEGGAIPELHQCFTNMKYILEEARLTFQDLVSVTVMLKDISIFAQVNEVYETYFDPAKNGGAPLPARACYAVADLPVGANVEISSIAVRGP